MPKCQDLAEKLGLSRCCYHNGGGTVVSNVCYNTCNASSYPTLCFYEHVLHLLSAIGLKPDTELQKKFNAMY